MTALETLVKGLIVERGPLTFAAYQELALYHPEHGYYRSAFERTGWRGDYLTAPELDPAFGALWAEGLRRIWTRCGAPPNFPVVEIGPGSGGLGAGILAAAEGHFAAALSLGLVEGSPHLARRQQARLAGAGRCSWVSSLDEIARLGAGCVIANEVLDNVPVHLLTVHDGVVTELWVTTEGDELALRAGPLSPPAAAALDTGCWQPPSPGCDVAVSPQATDLVTAAARLIRRGAVILIDYGYEPRGREAPVVCYSATGADSDPLRAPGAKDITVHVDWAAIRRALQAAGATVSGPVPQAAVLHALGAGTFDETLRTEHNRAVAEGRGGAAVRALARRSALATLRDRTGLGSFGVVTGSKGIDPPPWMRGSGDPDRC